MGQQSAEKESVNEEKKQAYRRKRNTTKNQASLKIQNHSIESISLALQQSSFMGKRLSQNGSATKEPYQGQSIDFNHTFKFNIDG